MAPRQTGDTLHGNQLIKDQAESEERSPIADGGLRMEEDGSGMAAVTSKK